MFCHTCQTLNADSAVGCINCGAVLPDQKLENRLKEIKITPKSALKALIYNKLKQHWSEILAKVCLIDALIMVALQMYYVIKGIDYFTFSGSFFLGCLTILVVFVSGIGLLKKKIWAIVSFCLGWFYFLASSVIVIITARNQILEVLLLLFRLPGLIGFMERLSQVFDFLLTYLMLAQLIFHICFPLASFFWLYSPAIREELSKEWSWK